MLGTDAPSELARMQKSLLIKAASIAVVFALVLIPLRMIDGLTAERANRQQAVVAELAATSYGRQTIGGPVLSIPYVEEYEAATGRESGVSATPRRVERIERVAYFFPATNTFDGTASVDVKSRGLFKARVFEWRGTARGEFAFDGAARLPRTRSDSKLTFGAPVVSVIIGDPRGLSDAPTLDWAGQTIRLERGSGLPRMGSGLHAAVPPLDPTKPSTVAYALALGVQGSEALTFVPLADVERAHLASSWPHASFGGQFLPRPDSQRRGADGIDAQWVVTALASQAQTQVQAVLDGGECRTPPCADRFEVRFVDPIDIYALSDRALKYGFLFVGLTFGCFVLFEVLKALRIHPAQYFLVGLALATFFLLLLALSEHVSFALAYALASFACVALLGFYLSAALGNARRGLGFAAMLTALYSALYVLLVSEDHALLLGALVVFALVAAALVATRGVDWYALPSHRRA